MLRSRPWTIAGVLVGVAAVIGTSDAAAKPKKKKPRPVLAAAAVPATKETKDTAPKGDAPADFDKQAAATAILEASLQKCKATNAARGEGHVTITFSKDGVAKAAVVDKGPWVGSPVAKCMAKEFKKVKIPPFHGEPVTVGKSFRFD